MKTPDSQNDDNLLAGLKRLYHHVSSARRWQFGKLTALMLVSVVAQLFTLGALLPFVAVLSNPEKIVSYPMVRELIALGGWSGRGEIVFLTAGVFAVLAVLSGLLMLYMTWFTQKFSFRVGHDLSVQAFRHTLYQPYLYHTLHNSSSQIAAVNKVDAVVAGVVLQWVQLISALVLVVFIVLAMIAIDPMMTIVGGVGFGLAYLIVTRVCRFHLRRNSEVWAKMQTSRVKVLQEALGGVRDIILDRSHANFIKCFAEHDNKLRDAQASNQFIANAPRFIIESIALVLVAGAAVAVSNRSGGLQAALPVLATFSLGALRVLPQMQQIYDSWSRILGQRQALMDVLDTLELPVAAEFGSETAVTPLGFEREICLRQVSFGYSDDRAMVLRQIDLVIPKGARVGFVGPTGSGKSTVIDLIMGLVTPTSGEIRIDDTILTPETAGAWQARIAHVPQAIYLADTTIAGNIAFGEGASKVDIERVRKAARQAELHDFVETLPRQYDTIVGERGIQLSGGQRQRIGIARALYKNADVLVLDEATNALDNFTEAAVMRSIEGLRRDLTIIIIAHRVTTVAMCDRVVRLDGGRIVAEGHYDTILGATGPSLTVNL